MINSEKRNKCPPFWNLKWLLHLTETAAREMRTNFTFCIITYCCKWVIAGSTVHSCTLLSHLPDNSGYTCTAQHYCLRRIVHFLLNLVPNQDLYSQPLNTTRKDNMKRMGPKVISASVSRHLHILATPWIDDQSNSSINVYKNPWKQEFKLNCCPLHI